MDMVTFIAESAADAATQVRTRLGPQAVVVQVRPLPDSGRGWLGRKGRPRFEVLAYRPETPATSSVPAAVQPRLDVLAGDDVAVPTPLFDPGLESTPPLSAGAPSTYLASGTVQREPGLHTDEVRSVDTEGAEGALEGMPVADTAASSENSGSGTTPLMESAEWTGIPRQNSDENASRDLTSARSSAAEAAVRGQHGGNDPASNARTKLRLDSMGTGWRIGVLMEAAGFLPKEAQRVVDILRREHGDLAPVTIGDEVVLTKRALRSLWRPARPGEPGDLHVLIGASGVGKTTCLSKWLTQVALGQGHPVRVWRLDGERANTSDALVVYCDVLGVPLERRWGDADGVGEDEVGFVDLPGVDWRDAGALTKLGAVIRGLRRARVHLVVNGAYDMNLMLAQVRQFSVLPIEDLLVTHLDEESRWGKLWNLALGTNFTLRYLSAGQNVPGDFREATSDMLLERQFPA